MTRMNASTHRVVEREERHVADGFAGSALKLAISGSRKLVNNRDSLGFLEKPELTPS